MNRKRKCLLLSGVFALGVLTGCHQNPMKKEPVKRTVDVLLKAAVKAEKSMNIEVPGGRHYLACMNQTEKEVSCSNLFQNMLPIARQESGFQHLSLNDLTNAKAFERIKEEYDMALFYVDITEEL